VVAPAGTPTAPAPESLAELADFYARAIRGRQPGGPYRLAGWSTGGIFAVMVAQALESQGEQVCYLGLLDCRRPAEAETSPAVEAWLIPSLATVLQAIHGRQLSTAEMHAMRGAMQHAGLKLNAFMDPANDARAERVLRQSIGLDITHGTLAAMRDAVRNVQSHFSMLEAFTPVALHAPIHRVWAESASDDAWPLAGGHLPVGGIRHDILPADHHSMLRPPHAALIADVMTQAFPDRSSRNGRQQPQDMDREVR
jgi:arthrofactin-type cyclic lipopeptide synthetase C